MKQSYPINKENFPSAWRYANQKLKWAKKLTVVEKLTLTIAQTLFLLLFMVILYGILYSMGGALISDLVGRADIFVQIWEAFVQYVLKPEYTEIQRILACLGVLYLVPFAASLPFAALIVLVYHPRPHKLSDSASELSKSKQIYDIAQETKRLCLLKHTNATSTCNMIFSVTCVAAMLALIVYMLTDPSVKSIVNENGSRINWLLFLIGVVLFFCYKFINLPLTLMLGLLYRRRLPRELLKETENYWLTCEKKQAATSEPAPSE